MDFNILATRAGQDLITALSSIAERMRITKPRRRERIAMHFMAAIISTGNVERNYKEPQESVNVRIAKTAVDAAEALIAELDSRK